MRWAIEMFRYYLWGQLFQVVIDHATFQWLHQMKGSNGYVVVFGAPAIPIYRTLSGHAHTNALFFSWQAMNK